MDSEAFRSELAKWLASIPRWQQYALSLLGDTPELSEEQHRQVCHALLSEHDLSEWDTEFEGYSPAIGPDDTARQQPAFRLSEIRHLDGINAISPTETIPFGQQLTVVYGLNASGKSGYARVLASACHCAGGPRPVLPNVYVDHVGAQSAEIVLASASSEDEVLIWTPEASLPKMARFAFFDNVATQHYLSRPTAMRVGPTVLDCFDKLATLIAGPVSDTLNACLDRAEPAEDLATRFTDGTQAHRLLRDPTQPDAIDQLAALCQLSGDEEAELDRVRVELKKLAAPDLAQTVAKLRKQKSSVDGFAAALSRLHAAISDSVMNGVAAAHAALTEAAATAQRAGAQAFLTANLTTIGTPEWRAFVKAASDLAASEASARGRPYPEEDDICLLCHQPLAQNAAELVSKYSAYLQADAEQRLASAEKTVEKLKEDLSALQFDQLASDRTAAEALATAVPDQLPELQRHLQILARRRDQLLARLAHGETADICALPDVPQKAIDAASESLEGQIEALSPSDIDERLVALRKRECELSDRQLLRKIRPEAEAFIERRQWLAKARAIRLDTSGITRKHTQLYNLLVTDTYKHYFAAECARLGLRVPVIATFAGARGQSQRKLKLEASQSCDLNEVLSEGEQRIAALADFLTEVGQTPSIAGIILDDPVCSLDHTFRSNVAQRLCQEAQVRQVIVFTHSLGFMCSLITRANSLDVDAICHWVEKTEAGAGVVSLNDGPPPEKKYKTVRIAQDAYERATAAKGSERLRAVRGGFSALRTTCEYFIVKELLGGVVERFAEEIRVRNLQEVHVEPEIVAEVVGLHGDLSRYIEGHLHSDTGSGDPPPNPNDLIRHIERFGNIRKKHEALKAASA